MCVCSTKIILRLVNGFVSSIDNSVHLNESYKIRYKYFLSFIKFLTFNLIWEYNNII